MQFHYFPLTVNKWCEWICLNWDRLDTAFIFLKSHCGSNKTYLLQLSVYVPCICLCACWCVPASISPMQLYTYTCILKRKHCKLFVPSPFETGHATTNKKQMCMTHWHTDVVRDHSFVVLWATWATHVYNMMHTLLKPSLHFPQTHNV